MSVFSPKSNCKKMMKVLVLLVSLSFVADGLPTIRSDWDRVIKGEDAKEGEFPWMASMRRVGKVPGHFCGASILTDTWALTAAHCCKNVINDVDFFIYVGSIYLDHGGSNHTISKVILHEDYVKFRDDICVVKVSKPFKFSPKVAQVTLAPKGWPVKNGDNATISGWGYTNPYNDGPKDLPNTLQKGVNFTVTDYVQCSLDTETKLHPGHVCAKGKIEGQKTWNGDSGGPLVKDGVQIGLTSFGFRPYEVSAPTVFSYTIYYVDWIKQKLGSDASKLKFK